MMKAAVFIFGWVYFTGCSVSSDGAKPLENNGNMYVVDLDRAEKTERILYSELFDGVETIILDTAQLPLVGMVNKLDVYRDFLFVLDCMQAKVLYMFDSEGKFIRRFGEKGGGPGEYADLADFTIDPGNGIVYLLDNQRQRINAYDVESGDFIRGIDLDRGEGVLSYHIQYANGAIFADAYFSAPSPKNYLLRKIDLSTGKQQASFLNTNKYNKGWNDLNVIDHPVFHRINADTVLFTHKFMDQIVLLGEEAVMPYLELRGKNIMHPQDVKHIDQNQDYFQIILELRRLNGIYNIRSCIAHGDSVFVECQKGGDYLSVLYDIKTDKTKYVYLKDDLLFAPEKAVGLLPSFGCANSEGRFYFTGPNALADLRASADNGRLSPDLDKIDRLKTLNDNANPVIFFYKYK